MRGTRYRGNVRGVKGGEGDHKGRPYGKRGRGGMLLEGEGGS